MATHCRPDREVCRPPATLGSATATIVVSTMNMNEPRQTATSGDHRRIGTLLSLEGPHSVATARTSPPTTPAIPAESVNR
ncbi:hypothetical protein GCM10009727_21110 [Actinomadura napierensis]|uniref:Uncharacterized protein n=1 Tax=Actinomadura napierensis TaxID=267854 RepID=A0ABN2YM70_9ACTN